MSGRLLPGKDEFEEYVRSQIVRELEGVGCVVVDFIKGDTDVVPFDWLLRMDDGSCIGVEVVRAEDQSQIHHVEKQAQAGDAVITGTAEMPWDSLRAAIDKKVANAGRYREALGQQCEVSELHLAVISGLQQLRFGGDLGEHMEGVARLALGVFDSLWLIQGDSAQRLT